MLISFVPSEGGKHHQGFSSRLIWPLQLKIIWVSILKSCPVKEVLISEKCTDGQRRDKEFCSYLPSAREWQLSTFYTNAFKLESKGLVHVKKHELSQPFPPVISVRFSKKWICLARLTFVMNWNSPNCSSQTNPLSGRLRHFFWTSELRSCSRENKYLPVF